MATQRQQTPPPGFRPRAERHASEAPSLREIMCRRCAGWMVQGDDMRWRHEGDGSLACLDPGTLLAYDGGLDAGR